jgi:hypothetical protein
MQHPGFAMMVTSSINLCILMLLRTVSHFEGEYMVRSQSNPKQGIMKELLITGIIGGAFVFIMIEMVKHVPWLWFPTSS